MNWQKTEPQKEGWYWRKSKWNEEIDIVKIREYGGKLCIGNWGLSINALWAGPIQEPEREE